MQNFTTDAINLKSYNLSESDKIIVMYSKDKGIIRGVAKGVKKSTSKLGGRMDMLIANKLMLHKGKNLDTICQAEAINTFKNTRNDMNKLFYSIYCSEIVHSFGIENDPNSEEIYDLLYMTLQSISKAQNKVELLISVLKFQLKLTHIAGYSIELENCVVCGCEPDENEIYYSAAQGGIVCKECMSSLCGALKLHNKLRGFLTALLQLDYNTKSRYDELANEKVCEFCFKLLKTHVEQHSPKKIKSSQMLDITN